MQDDRHTKTDTIPTMRSVLVEPRAGVRVARAEIPAPGHGMVLVRSTLVGICGSDTHALAGHHPFLSGPYTPGHEATGVVEALGEGVTGLTPGTRVLLKPNLDCGHCTNCRDGRTNACEELQWIGCDVSGRWPGAMADYFVAPSRNLFTVPDGVDDRTAVLVECLATPVHAVRLAGDMTGARVVVLGAGTIGALTVVAARQAGAGRVVVTDVDEEKLARARRIGASGGVLASSADLRRETAATLGGVADLVFDCVASETSMAQGIELLRRAGTLLIVGVPAGEVRLPAHLVQDREIRIQGCAAYTGDDIEHALDLASAGELPTDEITSGTFAVDEVAGAFDHAARGASGKDFIDLGAMTRHTS